MDAESSAGDCALALEQRPLRTTMNMKREFILGMWELLQLRSCLHCLMECSRELVNSFAVAVKIATSQANTTQDIRFGIRGSGGGLRRDRAG